MRWLIGGLVLALTIGSAHAQKDDTASIEENPALRIQVYLDRARMSPGPIDGKMGKNTELAIRAFQRMEGLEETGKANEDLLVRLEGVAEKPLTREYEITEEDVKGPFLERVPEKLEEMAELKHVSYTSVEEKLAEQFHMDIDYLAKLNPKADFTKAGTVIRVVDVERPEPRKAQRIEVDSANSVVRVFDKEDVIIAVYPATIGSTETPSPTGTHKITRFAKNPNYTYNPKVLDFKGVDAKEAFTIPPGPNGPVGVVWIGLSEKGYGIHGSAEPERVRREASHGCVRLTNWDALDLLAMVDKGIEVKFVEGDVAKVDTDRSKR